MHTASATPIYVPSRVKATRHEMYLARLYSRRPWRQIGEALGQRSPAAVSMAHNRIVHRLFEHESLWQNIQHMVQEFDGLGSKIEE